jgi:hypothetical protein
MVLEPMQQKSMPLQGCHREPLFPPVIAAARIAYSHAQGDRPRGLEWFRFLSFRFPRLDWT